MAVKFLRDSKERRKQPYTCFFVGLCQVQTVNPT
jgi:hypothetical protein